MGTASAFTTSYDHIEKRLINEAFVLYNGEQMHTPKAMWDTGANITCISRAVLERLELKPIGEAIVNTPAGETIVEKYIIDIKLQNNVTIKDVVVLATEIGQQGIDLLIGMDIISTGDFSISNYDGKTQFTFRSPSVEHADFTKGNP